MAESQLSRLQTMDNWDFEHFVADLWSAMGYQTTVREQSGDAGIDVEAWKDGVIDDHVVIQAKRYKEGNKVGGPGVQQYASLKHQEDADSVVIVTTSSFTRAAKERADELGVKLVSGEDLLTLIRQHDAHDILEQYSAARSKPAGQESADATGPGGEQFQSAPDSSAFFEFNNYQLGIGITATVALLADLVFAIANPTGDGWVTPVVILCHLFLIGAIFLPSVTFREGGHSVHKIHYVLAFFPFFHLIAALAAIAHFREAA